jgi:ribosomal-protein-alanine N-acetyltransferase
MYSSTFQIGRFRLSDVQSILAIEQASFGADAYDETNLLHWYQWRGDWFFVAHNDQGAIGYIVGAIEDNQGIVISLAVHPANRQSGVASALLKDLQASLVETGATAIKLHVRTTNQAAMRLYTKLGFAVEETIHNYYPDGASAFRMTQSLHEN